MQDNNYRYKYELGLKFDQVRRILVGIGKSHDTGEELRKMKSKHTLIVTDTNVHKFGLLDGVVESISASKVKYEIYEDISNEPNMSNIIRAVEFARKNGGFDSVVGIGGGSVLDTTAL